MLNAKEIQAAVEAVLFAAGEPLEISRISEAFEIEDDQTEQILLNLSAELDERNSGICLLKLENKYQLSTREKYASQIRTVLEVKKNTPLSQAAFEVLALVAYNQPVTKAFVEQVRGVDCSGVISTLCQKKLIEERGRLELPGRPLVYGTTSEFLRCFSLSSLDDLPELPEHETGERQLMFADGEQEISQEDKGEQHPQDDNTENN